MERIGEATWTGDLRNGRGQLRAGSGAFEGPYSFASRFESATGTNPEELLGAAHAACYSMALAASIGKTGHQPTSVHTVATVHLEKGESGSSITRIHLVTRGVVPGLPAADFLRLAEETKVGCIVSRALAALPMTLDAQLVGA